MAKQVKLNARPRAEHGRNSVKAVRARGFIPAVIYGAKDEPANLEVSRKDIDRLLSHAVGENILVELEIQDGTKTTNRLSLIQEVQHHPVRRDVLHVDFLAVSTTETIEAEVVVEPVGEADGVKNFGGLLEQSVRSLLVECLPQNLPEIIHVDVSGLKIGDSIHVRHIILPEGVKAALDPDLSVFRVSEPAVAEEPVAAAEGPTAPEVIKEKKTAEGAAPAAEQKK